MMKLVAVGNRFMRDDGIAVKVAEELRERLTNQNLTILIGETDPQSCFYLLNENDFVILLDAFCIETVPGSIHIFKLEDALLQPSGSFMQHDINIIELMKLYNSKFKGYIIGIEIADIGFGDELSPVLQNNFLSICSKIENTIKDLILEELNYA